MGNKNYADKKEAHCECGQVLLEVVNKPITVVACYCSSCQKAGRRLESLPGTPVVTEPDGSTQFQLYRKDRIHFITGKDLLKEHRLTPESTTRRVIACCCNSPMFLEFESGHWLSVYMNRFDDKDQRPIEIRTMTADKKAGVDFTDDIPSPKKHNVAFMWKLLRAWIAMGFRAPEIDYVKGNIYDNQ